MQQENAERIKIKQHTIKFEDVGKDVGSTAEQMKMIENSELQKAAAALCYGEEDNGSTKNIKKQNIISTRIYLLGEPTLRLSTEKCEYYIKNYDRAEALALQALLQQAGSEIKLIYGTEGCSKYGDGFQCWAVPSVTTFINN